MKLSFWKTHTDTAGQVDFSRLPRHIAIILDGNGRWAQRRGLPRTAGHRVGAETFRTIATYCRDIGIQYLTVYAFSTENWRRPPDEVETIMVLLKRYLLEAIDTMERDNVRLRFMGDMTPLSGGAAGPGGPVQRHLRRGSPAASATSASTTAAAGRSSTRPRASPGTA